MKETNAGKKKGRPFKAHLDSLAAFFTFRPLVYGYSNARVRAMRAALLSSRHMEDLLKMNSPSAVAEYLSSRTSYKEDFSNLATKMSDEERVEIAVSRNFGRTAQKLLRITPESSKATLAAFLKRYDIHNIKTVLLAKKLGRSAEGVRGLLIPAGTLKAEEVDRMLSAKSSEELYESIRGTECGQEFLSSASIRHLSKAQIKAALQNPESQSAQLDMLLASLDAYFYESAVSSIQPGEKDADILIRLIRSETDAKNAMTILRLKRAGADKETILSCLVEGGNFTRQQLEKMAGAKSVEAVASIASSFFISETGKKEFAEAEKRYKEDGQLSHFEVAFEHSLARKTLHTLRRSTMSIGAIVGFLFLKEEEMNNIRKIVRGKALGLSNEKIAEMLVLVG